MTKSIELDTNKFQHGNSTWHHSLSRRAWISFLTIMFATNCSCNARAQSQQLEPLKFAVPENATSLVRFLSTPRFAVLTLHADTECTKLLNQVINAKNYTRVLAKLKSHSDKSVPAQNALAVAQTLSMEWRGLKYRLEVESVATSEGRTVTEKEDDQGLLNFAIQLAENTLMFERLAKTGSKNAQINFHNMLTVIGIANAADTSWRGAIDPDNTNADLTSKLDSQVKQALREKVQTLLELLKKEPAAKAQLDELIATNYWPAIETSLRNQYDLQAEIAEIGETGRRLIAVPSIDATANVGGAGAIIQAAIARGISPPPIARIAGERAIELGSCNGHLVLFRYFESLGDKQEAEKILNQGAVAGQLDCVFELANRCYIQKDFAQARGLYETAFAGGRLEAALFLGTIHDLGLETDINVAQAVAYYEKAVAAGFPQATERLGQLYWTGVLKADFEKLDYQIPGLPLLPEPSAADQQTLANLAWAKVRFEFAASAYSQRGDVHGANRVQSYISRIDQQIVSMHADGSAPRAAWHERQDRMLDRSFDRQIEARNQNRRDIEERDRRINRYIK